MSYDPTKIVIGNLKMNGTLDFYSTHLKSLKNSLDTFNTLLIGLCVPYPYLFKAEEILKGSNIGWGSQNVAKFKEGAYTGEVSIEMIRDFSSTFVIIGHSERNTAYCESNENIADKFKITKDFEVTPILCVGETLIEREAGIMENVVESQLNVIIKKYGAKIFENTIIAYEPIWAIGSDMAATPEQINKMCNFIRKKINNNLENSIKNLKILYGGSVNTKNALQLFALEGLDGGLIGRASLSAEDFIEVCKAAKSAKNKNINKK